MISREKSLKPRDLLQGEEGTIIKDRRGRPRITLVYPNTYFLGMSNLGFQGLYALFNADPEAVCERAFLPDRISGNGGIPTGLRTVESGRAGGDCEAIAFSISFENDYLNLPRLLSLAGAPIYARARGENDPIVIAGGAAVTINPEPIAPFCDAVFVGEAEEAAGEIVAALRIEKSRGARLEALADIRGVYLPGAMVLPDTPPGNSICPANPSPNVLEERLPSASLRLYRRRASSDINGFPMETVVHTDFSEFGKLSLIEVQRGCGRGCKFCAEGFIYAPFRERDFELIREQVVRGLARRRRIGLIGADLLSYPRIQDLLRFIHATGGTFSPSSVRLDALTEDILSLLSESGHRTLAIAPETGSENLRRRLGKKFDNDEVVASAGRIVRAGIPHVKMYLMVGLPGETERDIDETAELVLAVRAAITAAGRERRASGLLSLSVNPFTPKPRTPYQFGVYAGVEEIAGKMEILRRRVVPGGGIRFSGENPFFAYVQAILSNGTRRVGDYIMEVFRNGGGLRKSLVPFVQSRIRNT